jgi:enolase
LDTIKLAVENAGYTFGDEIMIALDCAAEFYVNGKYDYSKFEGGETGKIRSSAEQVDYLAELVAKSNYLYRRRYG